MTAAADTALETKHLMNKLAGGAALGEDETTRALDLLTTNGTAAQMAAFLMALRVRGETVDELTGAARLLRARMTPVSAPPGAVDIVGTGGDSHGTYNVSTAAAIVAAGAGLVVAKHGNRSVSSLSGASDVLAALGVKLDAGPETVARAIAAAGVGFMWAPMHHPAMKAWASVRAELGVRSIFNLLGPVCNPAGVERQVLGVFADAWVEPMAQVLKRLGTRHAWVVHGADGLDELSTTGPSRVAEIKDGAIATFEVTPELAGLPHAVLADLKGGDAAVNAEAIRALLEGRKGPFRDIVLLNAAAALVVGGKATDIRAGAVLAASAIDTGRARAALDRLVAVTAGGA